MSGNIDRSLDDILKSNKSGHRRTRRVTRSSKPVATVAPAGGVRKNTKTGKAAQPARASTKKALTVPTGPASTGPSKIIVSNLPTDVTEAQIKDYFVQTIGPVKKVLLTYGPNGQSRGVATIIFSTSQAATESAKLLDGTKVDGRPMRVEVVFGAKDAPERAVKALSERISQPSKQPAKNQPKSAAKPAAAKAAAKNTKMQKGKPARGRNAGRPKPKTSDELDAEMNDYFVSTTGDANMGGAGGAVQPAATGGDAAMEDEVL